MIRETGFGSIRKVPAGLLAESWLRIDLDDGQIRPPFARGLRLPDKPGLWAPAGRRIIPLEAAISPGTPTAYDGASDQNHSFAIDTGAGSDRYLSLAYVVESSSPANGVPSTATYNGTSLASLISANNGGDMVVAFYGLHNPASGSNSLVFNLPANPPGELTIVYQTFSGVHQGSVPGDSVRATASDGTAGSSISLTLTSCVAGDYCAWAAGDFDDTAHTQSGSAVERLDTNFNPTGANLWYGTFAVTGDGNITGGASGGGDMIGVAVALIPATGTTDVTAEPTGVVGTGAVGSPTVITSCTVVPTGVSATGAAGTPVVDIGITVDVTGVFATGAAGSPAVTAGVDVPITGVSATGAAGDVNAFGGIIIIPEGVFGTTALGELTLRGVTDDTGVRQSPAITPVHVARLLAPRLRHRRVYSGPRSGSPYVTGDAFDRMKR